MPLHSPPPHEETTSAAIRAEGLTRSFGAVTAVEGLTFRVSPGEIFGLVGPDGAGKTTTMRLLAAILPPTAGMASVAGHEVVRQAEAVKIDIGYMSQRFGLYPDLSVLENIHFYADIYGVPHRGRQEKVTRLLEFSNLTPFTRRLAGNLSGGMKQKLGLACALVHTPKVLLLDEPTNGVDPVSRRDFWRILYQLLREQVTIFVSTAYLDEAERCNRVGLLHQGRLLAVDSPRGVKRLMRGSLLEIRGEQPRQIAAVLRESFPTGSVTLFGDRVHVLTPDAKTGGERVEALLAQRGRPVQDVRTIAPTLEDVFVSILASEAQEPEGGDRDTHEGELAVAVVGLARRFGSFVAVNQVSFDVPRGEIFGFLGPNGAGKSTTIRMLTGILAPSGGQGTVAGFDIGTQAEQIKTQVGYMVQKFSLYEDLTVEENIDFYSGIYRVDSRKRATRKAWVLEMAGLHDHRRSRTAILSSGWKQRLALGCAILHEPPIVFLDEPTSGVDPISRRRFWDLIYELAAQGVTVFVTTHYMEEAEYCDRLALIYRGELIASGSPASLKTEVMRQTVLDVLVERPQEAMYEVEAVPGVVEVALFGAGLHAVVDDPALVGPIRQRLEDTHYQVDRVEPIVPSLEDVFVSLIEARDRRDRAASVVGS